MQTNTAEIQQSAMKWIYVFDDEFRRYIIQLLQWKLILYSSRDSGYIYPLYFWQSLYWGSAHLLIDCLVNIAEASGAFVK